MIASALATSLTHLKVTPILSLCMVASIRVLIAGGHASHRSRLASVLRAQLDLSIAADAGSSLGVVSEAAEFKPDVILMDIVLANSDEVISKIKDSLSNAAVLVLSDSEGEEDVFLALESGAKGCVLKSSSPADIAQAIRKAADGQMVISPNVAAALMKRRHGKKPEANLSDRELQVLELLSGGLTNREIAARLLVTENTVKTYVHRLREKLHLKNRLQLGVYAVQREQSALRGTEQSKALDAPSTLADKRGAGSEPATESPISSPLATGGERKAATALSIEFRCHGDTAEAAHSDQADELIRECLQLAVDEIRVHEGTVAWFGTNGMMALFGLPISEEYAPHKALDAALAIQECISETAKQQGETGMVIETRIGISTGTVVMTEDANSLSPRYHPEKNITELAARARNMVGAGMVGVTESTCRMTRHHFVFEPQGEVWLNEPVNIYRLLGSKPATHWPSPEPLLNLTDFVGRQKEIEALKQAFALAKSGSGQVVGIVGEAGVGKSRLLREFRESLSGHAFTHLEGSCIHFGNSTPYLPFVQVLRSYFDLEEGDTEPIIRAKLTAKVSEVDGEPGHVLPPLHDILSLRVEDQTYAGLDPPRKRERVFEAIKDVLLMQSRSGAIVLAIEDLHWIDRTSEEVLSRLIDVLGTTPILLVLLYRPEYRHQWANKSAYSQITLNELSPDSSIDLVKAILDDGAVAPELPMLIIDRAGGNPLFIEELVQNLLESGAIRKKGQEYALDLQPSRDEIPASIRGIIAARIDQLDSEAKHSLQVAAVIGRNFSFGILESAASAECDLRSCLSVLLRSEFIYQRNPSSRPDYAFKHALIQEVAYSGLPLKSRKQIHRKVAKALEERYLDTLEELFEVLAYHYSHCGDQEEASRYLRLSGDKASRICSNWEAVRLYGDAIDALRRQDGSRDNQARQLDIRLAMDMALKSLDYPDGSLENLEEAQRLATEIGNAPARIIVLGKKGWYHMIRGQCELGLKETKESFEEAAEAEDCDLAVPVALNLVQAMDATGDWKSAEPVACRAISLLERSKRELEYYGGWGNENVYCALLAFRGCSLEHLGRFDEAQIVFEKSVSFARQINHPASIGFALHLCGTVFWVRGDGLTAAKYLQEALPLLEKVGNSMLFGACSSTLGIANLLQGNHQAAVECVDRGLEVHQRIGVNVYLANFLWTKGWVQLEMGHIEEARCALEEGLRVALLINDRMAEGVNKIYLGRAMSKAPNPLHRDAEQSIKHGLRIFEELELKPWYAQGCLFLGELYADTGKNRKAQLNLKKAEDMFREMKMDYWSRRTQEVSQRLESHRPDHAPSQG
jgi:DNA-binding NarL/FixJ family response regulator/tetratricopeptide (TPR) repeat protein